MIKVSCQVDPNLDQLNPLKVRQIVVDTFNYQNISKCEIGLIFVSDEFLSDLKKNILIKINLLM